MNIDEIVEALKQISVEVEKLQPKVKSPECYNKQEEYMIEIAKTYPFKSHVLTKCDENIRSNYIAVLMSLFDIKEDEDLRLQRMLLIYRIIASFERQIDVSRYVTKSMKIGIKFWDDFLTILDSKVKFCFIVDVLLLGMLDVNLQKSRKYELISDILQFSQFNHKTIKKAALVTNSILKQDFELFIQIIEPNDCLDYNCFLGYFECNQYTAIESDFSKVKDIKGDILIVNATISYCEDIINLDEYEANSIYFKRCMFERIKGIKSSNKQVVFEECNFEGNLFNCSERHGLFGTIIECEKNYTFIQGKKYKFWKTKFSNCKVTKSLLDISESEVIKCEFVECQGQELSCSYLLELTNSNLLESKIYACKIKTDRENRRITQGGIVLVKYGNISECHFEKCESYGDTGYGSCATYEMQVVCANASTISGNEFIDCNCTTRDTSNRTVISYIIGMIGAKQNNNTFTECKSYHYQFSTRGSSYNIGEID